MKTAALYLLCSSAAVFAFSPPATSNGRCERTILSASEATEEAVDAAAPTTSAASIGIDDINNSLQIPLTYNEMVLQASQCMSDAYAQGMTRQIVRILLPRDATSEDLGKMYEAEAQTSNRSKMNDMKLVPTDESWQGGIMQLYRASSPAAKDLLRKLSPTTATTGVPPKIVEDRTIDESGVDGVGLLYTQIVIGGSGGGTDDEVIGEGDGGVADSFGRAVNLPTLSEGEMCVFVQPTQEAVDSIDELSTGTGSPLVALLNPQWRQVDDALDSASKSDGVFGALASFLGGKGSVLRRLDELGYRPAYTLEGYVCKGGNVRLIKRFDSDWIVFAENDTGDKYVRVGSMAERPSYQDVEKMLNDKDIGYKYARDLGMAPKL